MIPEENYAVFHLTLPDSFPDTEEDRLRYIGDISQQLARYIRDIWVPSNEKSLKYMSHIYEVFDKQECRIYIPLLKGMGGTQMSIHTENGTDTWIQYIDEHILEDITIRQIAEHFHYSPNHFADIFRLYYGMNLLDYIQKRKLYQIAREQKDHKLHIHVYRMMTICVLYGWIKEYRVRVDLERITFMRFFHGKLYTYVPIYE